MKGTCHEVKSITGKDGPGDPAEGTKLVVS